MDLSAKSAKVAQPDVMLTLDCAGAIEAASLSTNVADEDVAQWLGKPWADTLDRTGAGKIAHMLEDARAAGVSGFRQVMQSFPSGRELPIEYAAIQLADRDGMMVIGRNLQGITELQSRLISVQQAREQDYWKLREVESRYRLLFDASNEAVLMINAETSRVLEANPAAIRTLGVAPGWDFRAEMAAPERDKFIAMLDVVRQQGRAPGLLLHLGPEPQPWVVRASLMTAQQGSIFMLQLTPLGAVGTAGATETVPAEELMERLPDAFATIDRNGVVLGVNRAFLDTVQASVKGAVIGRSLGRWLSRPGADLSVLLASLKKHHVVRGFATAITGELGVEAAVELSAAVDNDSKVNAIGILMRDISLRAPGDRDASAVEPVSHDIMIDQIGRTPLSALVTETVSVIERRYIEAALGLVDGNRTAAAKLLGVSRQGLYAKLARYGIEGAGDTPDA